MKKANRKGFTVAELLIVVAIIAVLVGIAIPVFRHKAEKAKEAYDIYTMRQAASAAIELYYLGINETNAGTNGLSWSPGSGATASDGIHFKNANAYGAYDPSTGRFLKDRGELDRMNICRYGTGYGKGTSIDGKTKMTTVDGKDAYRSGENYTNAVLLVSIFPYADSPYLIVYWKNHKLRANDTDFIGGGSSNMAKVGYIVYLN